MEGRYRRSVITLALLIEPLSKAQSSGVYRWEGYGTRVSYEFPVFRIYTNAPSFVSLTRRSRSHYEIVDFIAEYKRDRDQKFTVKQLEKTKKGLEAKLKKLNDDYKKDDVVTFEELGIDKLFVDEVQAFKNLYVFTKMRNVAGITSTDSQKSSNILMKCHHSWQQR